MSDQADCRPKCFCTTITLSTDEIESTVKEWLEVTIEKISNELTNCLQVITNIRGLYGIREEALKVGKCFLPNLTFHITFGKMFLCNPHVYDEALFEGSTILGLPSSWKTICTETNLPNGFHPWYYFFQSTVTKRAKELLRKKVLEISSNVQAEITDTFKNVQHSEDDLRWYTWNEDSSDISRTENLHTGTKPVLLVNGVKR